MSMTSSLSLTVGCDVIIGAVKPGKLRYLGRVHFAEGEWCGVELLEPDGLHDGSVAGVRYFICPAMCGIFAPRFKVTSPEHEYTPLQDFMSREVLSETESYDTNSLEDLSRLANSPSRSAMKVGRSSSIRCSDDVTIQLSNEMLHERKSGRKRIPRPTSALVGGEDWRRVQRRDSAGTILKSNVLNPRRNSPMKHVTFSDEHDLDCLTRNSVARPAMNRIGKRQRKTWSLADDPYRALARGFDLEVRRIQGDTEVPVSKPGGLFLAPGVMTMAGQSKERPKFDEGEFEKSLDQEIGDMPTPDSEEIVMMKSSDESVCSVEQDFSRMSNGLEGDCKQDDASEPLSIKKSASNDFETYDSCKASSVSKTSSSSRKVNEGVILKEQESATILSSKKYKKITNAKPTLKDNAKTDSITGMPNASVELARTALSQYADLLKAVQIDRAKAANKRHRQPGLPRHSSSSRPVQTGSNSKLRVFVDTELSGGTESLGSSDWLTGASAETTAATTWVSKQTMGVVRRSGSSCSSLAGEQKMPGEDEEMEFETFDGEELNVVVDSADEISDNESIAKRNNKVQEKSSHYCLTTEVSNDLDSECDDLLTDVQFPGNSQELDNSPTDGLGNHSQVNSSKTLIDQVINSNSLIDNQGNYSDDRSAQRTSHLITDVPELVNKDVVVMNNINAFVCTAVDNFSSLMSQKILPNIDKTIITSQSNTGNKNGNITGGVTESDLRGSMTSSGYMTDSVGTNSNGFLTDSELSNSGYMTSSSGDQDLISALNNGIISSLNSEILIRSAGKGKSLVRRNVGQVVEDGGGIWRNQVEGEREERPMSLISNGSTCAESGGVDADTTEIISSFEATAAPDQIPVGNNFSNTDPLPSLQNQQLSFGGEISTNDPHHIAQAVNCGTRNVNYCCNDAGISSASGLQNRNNSDVSTVHSTAGYNERKIDDYSAEMNTNNNSKVKIDCTNANAVVNLSSNSNKSSVAIFNQSSQDTESVQCNSNANNNSSDESLNSASKSSKDSKVSTARSQKSRPSVPDCKVGAGNGDASQSSSKGTRVTLRDKPSRVSSRPISAPISPSSSAQRKGLRSSRIPEDQGEGQSLRPISGIGASNLVTRRSKVTNSTNSQSNSSSRSASVASKPTLDSCSSNLVTKKPVNLSKSRGNIASGTTSPLSKPALCRSTSTQGTLRSSNQSTNSGRVSRTESLSSKPPLSRASSALNASRTTNERISGKGKISSSAESQSKRSETSRKASSAASTPENGTASGDNTAISTNDKKSVASSSNQSKTRTQFESGRSTSLIGKQPASDRNRRDNSSSSKTRSDINKDAADKKSNFTQRKEEVAVKLKIVEENLKAAEEKIGATKAEKAAVERDIASLRMSHQMALDDLQREHERAVRELELSLNEAATRTLEEERSRHSKDLDDMKNAYETQLNEEQEIQATLLRSKNKEISELQDQHDRRMKECEKTYNTMLSNLEEQHQAAESNLKIEMEQLKVIIAEQKKREEELNEKWKKTEQELARDLSLEAESLRIVLEQKNEEIHRFRYEINVARQKLEELPKQRDLIERLQQKIDNLEAVVCIKTDNERSMSERQAALLRRCERESKDKNRLSMNNEQLQWLLTQGVDAESESDDFISQVTDMTRSVVTRRRGSASRVTPGCHASRMSRSCDTSLEPRQRITSASTTPAPPAGMSSVSSRLTSSASSAETS